MDDRLGLIASGKQQDYLIMSRPEVRRVGCSTPDVFTLLTHNAADTPAQELCCTLASVSSDADATATSLYAAVTSNLALKAYSNYSINHF